jgi:hypothetical protein
MGQNGTVVDFFLQMFRRILWHFHSDYQNCAPICTQSRALKLRIAKQGELVCDNPVAGLI